MSQNVYRSKALSAFFSLPGGDASQAGPARIVTFESVVGARSAQPREPFGAQLASKYGVPVLHVVPEEATWYNEDDIDACLSAVAGAVAPSAFVYGSSMGGYAVSHFADALGVATGLCLSPQVSIQPTVVPFESRWRNQAAEIRFRRSDIPPSRRAKLWIFVDPEHENDRRHAEAIASAGPTEVVYVPFGGHPVGHSLVEGRCLSTIVRMFVDGDPDREAIEGLIAAGLENSPTCMVNRARPLRGTAREEVLRRACELNPKHAKAAFTYGIELLRRKRIEEANVYLSRVIRPPFRESERLRRYKALCEAIGVPPTLLTAAEPRPPRPVAGARPMRRVAAPTDEQ